MTTPGIKWDGVPRARGRGMRSDSPFMCPTCGSVDTEKLEDLRRCGHCGHSGPKRSFPSGAQSFNPRDFDGRPKVDGRVLPVFDQEEVLY